MKIEEQIKQKLDEAIDILKKFGMPSAQQNERTAYCLLSLLNVTPEKDCDNDESDPVLVQEFNYLNNAYFNGQLRVYAIYWYDEMYPTQMDPS